MLEFWDTEEMTLLSAGEHFMAQEVQWDPTGRYVATIVNAGEWAPPPPPLGSRSAQQSTGAGPPGRDVGTGSGRWAAAAARAPMGPAALPACCMSAI